MLVSLISVFSRFSFIQIEPRLNYNRYLVDQSLWEDTLLTLYYLYMMRTLVHLGIHNFIYMFRALNKAHVGYLFLIFIIGLFFTLTL